ncbi:AKP8L protein, partial [Climacteris rufus]|nr:AKP8L protein [Climacteris rufus]
DYPDYPDYPTESEHDADNFYGNRREFPGRSRENFAQRSQWGRERIPGYPGRGAWNEPRGIPGSKRLPSLFAHNILPEAGAFPGMRAFPGNFRGMKARMRRSWKVWDVDFRLQRRRLRREPPGRKRKQPGGPEEPESKAAKTDGSDNSDWEFGEGRREWGGPARGVPTLGGSSHFSCFFLAEEGTEGESGEKEGSRGVS